MMIREHIQRSGKCYKNRVGEFNIKYCMTHYIITDIRFPSHLANTLCLMHYLCLVNKLFCIVNTGAFMDFCQRVNEDGARDKRERWTNTEMK